MKASFPPFLIVACAALMLAGAGCGTTTTGTAGPDGGMWKSSDRGVTWANKRALVVSSKVTATGALFNVTDMVMDPQDNKTIYLATAQYGLVYSLDGGDSWQLARISGVSKINAIAVDPKQKCTVYATSGNKIYKTVDCARDWQQIFFEPRTAVTFTRLVVDWYNPTNLYVGTSDGDILRSQSQGVSWEKVERIDGVPAMELVRAVQDAVNPVGYSIYKSEERMSEALQMVLDVKERLPQVTATDPHYLVAAHDARNMALSAELFYRTALTRKESRGWFIREDYPERDDAEWLKWVNAEPHGDGMRIWTEDVPVADYPFQPTAPERS